MDSVFMNQLLSTLQTYQTQVLRQQADFDTTLAAQTKVLHDLAASVSHLSKLVESVCVMLLIPSEAETGLHANTQTTTKEVQGR